MNTQAPASLAQRLDAQRTQVFKVMSIVEACRLGSDSMLATICGGDEPDFGDALAAAYELLDDVADELEAIAGDGDGDGDGKPDVPGAEAST